MTFDEFFQDSTTDLYEILRQQEPNIQLKSRFVEKLNSQSYRGLIISNGRSNQSPVLNMDHYFCQLKQGESYENILSDMTMTYRAAIGREQRQTVPELRDYFSVKDRLFIELVGSYTSKENLQSIPHQEIEDLSMICRLVLSNDDRGLSSMIVDQNMLNMFGVSKEQLFRDALEASERHFPSRLQTMGNALSAIMPLEEPALEFDSEFPMYIASNDHSLFGAGVVMYPGFLEQAREKIGVDLFLLPSSLHEMIIVPDNGIVNLSDLEQMVHDVNRSDALTPEDLLSDHVYHYDGQTFELARNFEDRVKNREPAASVLEDLKHRKEAAAHKAKESAEHAVWRSEDLSR